MHAFGQPDEEGSPHRPPSTKDTQFTFTSTHIQTSNCDATCTSPFLKLPAELRNKIYEFVARDQQVLKLYAGQVVLPPLGNVCKKIRTEMQGNFEQEVSSDATLRIQARVVNFNFWPVFKWLDEKDKRSAEQQHMMRKLTIHVTVIPQSWKIPFMHLGETSSRRSILRKEERLPHLLLSNLFSTLRGWDWMLRMFRSIPNWPQHLNLQQSLRAVQTSAPIHGGSHTRCRRYRTGHHYLVGIVADNSWDCLSPATHAKPKATGQGTNSARNSHNSSLDFWRRMYDEISSAGRIQSDVDRKLTLILREACRPDRIRVAKSFGEFTSCVALKRAVDQHSRLEIEVHAQHRRGLALLASGAEGNTGQNKRNQPDSVRASKRRCIAVDRGIPVGTGWNLDGSEIEVEEITRMMANWRLGDVVV